MSHFFLDFCEAKIILENTKILSSRHYNIIIHRETSKYTRFKIVIHTYFRKSCGVTVGRICRLTRHISSIVALSFAFFSVPSFFIILLCVRWAEKEKEDDAATP